MPPESVNFDRAADYYDETRDFPPGEEAPIAALIARAGSLTSSSRVLEIGVGTGRIALPLSAHTGLYVGLDLSRAMMLRLRAKPGGNRIALTQGDATRLPYSDKTFDAAVAVHVFHLIPDWRAALDELRRVLRPGAPLLNCGSQAETTFKVLWDAWNTAIPHNKGREVGARWRENERFLDEASWRLVGEPHVHVYRQTTTLRQFFERVQGRVWSSCWRVSDDELARGLAAMQAVVPAHFPDPDAPITYETVFYAQVYLPPR